MAKKKKSKHTPAKKKISPLPFPQEISPLEQADFLRKLNAPKSAGDISKAPAEMSDDEGIRTPSAVPFDGALKVSPPVTDLPPFHQPTDTDRKAAARAAALAEARKKAEARQQAMTDIQKAINALPELPKTVYEPVEKQFPRQYVRFNPRNGGRPKLPEHLKVKNIQKRLKAEEKVYGAPPADKVEKENVGKNFKEKRDPLEPPDAEGAVYKKRGDAPLVRLKFDAGNPSVRAALPHIFGWKWYSWARAFYESKNRMNLLCAANQISKSSTQIRKCIDWATNKKKWVELWPNRQPRIFWYLYPSNPVVTIEFEKKWLVEFLPRGGFENDVVFGYRVERKKDTIIAIHFHSGISVYFKTYMQNVNNLQTATVDAIFCDEELPEEIYDEIKARLFATKGYFSMVFTATLNQDMWRRAMEGAGDQELFPDAFKLQVSMYDCLVYDDGTPSLWTEEAIRSIESECKSELEVARRVHGKFVSEAGRTYPAFDAARHFVKPQRIPADWDWYSGVDIGGGGDGHPSAIVFIAVRPDRQMGFVSLGWRGDGEITTAGDVLQKYLELKPRVNVVRQSYDWAAKDFKTIAGRVSETVGAFEQANKGHEVGETTTNTLFRSKMLFIFDTEELRKLGSELSSLMKKTLKPNAKDDFIDAMRYAIMSVPWDFSAIAKEFDYEALKEAAAEQKNEKPLTEAELLAEQIRQRRGELNEKKEEGWEGHFEEIEEWNDAYG